MTALDPIDPRKALELYLADREGDLSQSSIRSHRYRLSNFVDWLDEREITNMNELTGRLVKEYQLESRKAGDWSPSTEKAMMDTIRVFMRWCESIEAVEGGLSERIQSPTISDGDAVRSEHLDAETAQAVLENLDMFHYSSRPHVTLAVMWNTMARRGAVRSLDLDDYDSADRSLRFEHRPDTGTPLKNKRTSERHVAISESLADLLDDWIEYKRPDVTDEYGREPLITTRNGRIATGTIRGTRTSTPNRAGTNGDAPSTGTPRPVSRPSTPRSVAVRSPSHLTRSDAVRLPIGSGPTSRHELFRIARTSRNESSRSTTTSALTRRRWNSDGGI